jgi:hypothetical protein
MARLSAAALLARLTGLIALALSLSALCGPALADASGHRASPDPSPQPAPGAATSAPTPDPAPQAGPSSSSTRSTSIPPQQSTPGTQPTVLPSIGAGGVGVAEAGVGSAEAGVGSGRTATTITAPNIQLAPRPTHRRHVVKRPRAVRTVSRPPELEPAWRGPDPFDVVSTVAVTAPSPRRDGLPLLLGSLGLLVLVVAGGSTLRMLLRIEGRLRAG